MVYLNKNRLPKGSHNKLMMRKIGPCKILEKYGPNAYKIELPDDIAISLIFNVADLTLYRGPDTGEGVKDSVQDNEEWVQYLPPKEPPKMECILDSRTTKKTRNQTYFEHLVKWQGLPDSEATWMLEEDIKK